MFWIFHVAYRYILVMRKIHNSTSRQDHLWSKVCHAWIEGSSKSTPRTTDKWWLINWPKITQMPQNVSAQNCLSKPKSLAFRWKTASLGVRSKDSQAFRIGQEPRKSLVRSAWSTLYIHTRFHLIFGFMIGRSTFTLYDFYD